MQPNVSYYEESGQYNPLHAAGTLLLLLAISLILGYAYSAIVLFNPLIYLNFLACIGVGLALDFIAGHVFDFLKIRSRKLKIIFVIAASLFAWYCQWCATLDYFVFGEIDSVTEYLASLDWILYPEIIFENLGVAYDYGYYEMFGTAIKGPILVVVWVLELVIFIGYPALKVIRHVARPYSEKNEQWYPIKTLEKQYRVVTSAPSFAQQLSSDPANYLSGLSAGRGNAFSTVQLYYLEEESDQYISVFNTTLEGKDNKPKQEFIINNLTVSKSQAREILDANSYYPK